MSYDSKLVGDATGPLSATVVEKIQGNPIKPETEGSAQDGYALTWVNADGYWEAKPIPTSSSVTLTGDVSGASSANTVDKLKGKNLAVSMSSVGSAQDGYVITWINGSTEYQTKPIPTQTATGSAGGDLSGTYPNPTVAKVRGNAYKAETPSSAQDGYVPTWVNANNEFEVKKIPVQTATGSAGGDLSGTYPNPTVAKIQNNSVKAETPNLDGYVLTWNQSDTRWESRLPPVASYAEISYPIFPWDPGYTTNKNLFGGNSIDTNTQYPLVFTVASISSPLLVTTLSKYFQASNNGYNANITLITLTDIDYVGQSDGQYKITWSISMDPTINASDHRWEIVVCVNYGPRSTPVVLVNSGSSGGNQNSVSGTCILNLKHNDFITLGVQRSALTNDTNISDDFKYSSACLDMNRIAADSAITGVAPDSIFNSGHLLRWYKENYDGAGTYVDETGNYNTTQANAGEQPSSTTINGHTCAHFDGGDALAVTNNTSFANAISSPPHFTIFGVVSPDDITLTGSLWALKYTNPGFDLQIDPAPVDTGTFGRLKGWVGANTHPTSNYYLSNDTAYTFIMTWFAQDGADGFVRVYLNGNLSHSLMYQVSTYPSNDNGDLLAIGAAMGTDEATIRNGFTGKIGNTGLADRVATQTEIAQLHRYLADWAGIE